MNQEKIGKFIANLRKEKNMTQQELANILNVTDRAVSHWENGRRLPDISLFKNICDIFNISLNEFLSGEKINEDKIIKKSEENIINTLKDSKKNKKKDKIIITILFIGIILLLLIIFILKQNKYPKIEIDNFTISHLDKPNTLKKVLNYDNKDIYYYGIENAFICDKKDNCYTLTEALKNNQVSIDKLEKYLKKQVEYENINISILYDGGSTIYQKGGFIILKCNTITGNNDLYIGNDFMLEDLNGNYCGNLENSNKSFIKTYKVISSKINENSPEFNDVTLKQSNGLKATVLINNSYNLVPGKTYEFTFLTFENFEDTIENIFLYSTLLKASEIDIINEQINENIIINNFNKETSFNELKYVNMQIIENTLTNVSATILINDYSNHKYIYGSDYIIEKYENNTWNELKNICDNCVFNSIAYDPDINGHLLFNLNWETIYGKLSNGKYRIIKNALLNSDIPCEKECKKYYISVEFEIK